MTSIADAISDALFGTIGRDPHDLVPDLYEDLVIRQDGARFDDHGRFTGFGFELGIRRDARVADPEIRYKHVALYRLSRIAPIEIQRAQEGVNLVDLHRDLLYGLAQNAVHPLTVVGNDPARHGVLFLVGAQAIGRTRTEAEQKCHEGAAALLTQYRGVYRQTRIEPLREAEVEWLLVRLRNWREIAAFRGIPQPRREASPALSATLAGVTAESTIAQQIELFCRAVADKEYLLTILASPLETRTVERLLRKVSRQLEKIEPDIEVTRTQTAGVSLPFLFAGNTGGTDGLSQGATAGVSHGVTDGASVGQTSTTGTSQTITDGTQTSLQAGITHSVGASTGTTEGLQLSHGTSDALSHSLQHSAGIAHSKGINTSESATKGVSSTRTDSAATSHGVTDTQGSSQSTTDTQGSSQSVSVTHGSSQSVSVTQGQSASVTQTQGQSSSVTNTEGTSQSVGTNTSANESVGTSTGTSQGIGTSSGMSENLSNSVGASSSVSHGASIATNVSHQVSTGQNESSTAGVGTSAGETSSVGISAGHSLQGSESTTSGRSYSDGLGNNTSYSLGRSAGTTGGASEATNASASASRSETGTGTRGTNLSLSADPVGVGASGAHSDATSVGSSGQVGTGVGLSHTDSAQTSQQSSLSGGGGASANESWAQNQSAGTSISAGTTTGSNAGLSHSVGVSTNNSDTTGSSVGVSSGTGVSQGLSSATSTGKSAAVSFGEGASQANSTSAGISSSHSLTDGYGSGVSETQGSSQSVGVTQGTSSSVGVTQGVSDSVGVTQGTSQSVGVTQGTSQSVGVTQGSSASTALSRSETTGVAEAAGTSSSLGISKGDNFGLATNTGVASGVSTQSGTNASTAISQGTSQGSNLGVATNLGQGVSSSQSVANGVSDSQSSSTQQSVSYASSEQAGTSTGSSLGASWGMAGSMGIAPMVSLSLAKKLYDEHKRAVATTLTTQRNRMMTARQEGAFQGFCYLVTPDPLTKEQCVAAAMSAFWGPAEKGELPVRFHALNDLPREEAAHLLAHARTFSACRVREPSLEALEAYAYSTVLTTSELAVLSHPPRIDLPGIQSSLEPVPAFRVPTTEDGQIHLGHVVNAEIDEVTDYRFGLHAEHLAHVLVAGETNMGKTVTAQQLFANYVNLPPKSVAVLGEGGEVREELRHYGGLVLDWKRTWRGMLHHVPRDRFRFVSLWDPSLGFKYNLLQVPAGVPVSVHQDMVCEALSLAMGLGQRGRGILRSLVGNLYRRPMSLRYLDPDAAPGAESNVMRTPALSRFVGMADLYEEVCDAMTDKGRTQIGNNLRDGYQVVQMRLQQFAAQEEMAKIYTRDTCEVELAEKPAIAERAEEGEFTLDGCLTIHDLVAPGEVVVMEGGPLDPGLKKAVITSLVTSIFTWARIQGDRAFDPAKLVVLEEAHQVLVSGDDADAQIGGIGETIWEQMWNEGRSYGIKLMAICQMPDKMPDSVVANSGTVISHAVSTPKAQETVMTKIGKDLRIDHRQYGRFLAKIPQGRAIVCSKGRGGYLDADPVLVAPDLLDHEPPSDEVLRRYAVRPRRNTFAAS